MIYVLIPSTPERAQRLQAAKKSVIDSKSSQLLNIKTEISSGEGFVKPFLRLLNSVNGYVFMMADDAILDEDCLERLYQAFTREFPDNEGIAVPDDGIWNCELATFFFGHTDFLKKIVCDKYVHNYFDNDITEQCKLLGKYLRVPIARLTHQHYIKDQKLFDETYRFSRDSVTQDQKLFSERKTNNFK